MKFNFTNLLLSILPIFTNALKHINFNEHNFVSLIGPVTTNSVDSLLWEWNDPKIIEDINNNKQTLLYINSPGGSVHAGNHLIQYIKSLQSQNITVNCVAQNFISMAFAIFQSCDYRFVLENSIGMQHQMSFGIKGNIENIRNLFALNNQINEKLIELELKKIQMDKKEYLEKTINDWWIYGDDNIAYNTADELSLISCSTNLNNLFNTRKEYLYNMEFQVQIPKCPLFKDIQVSNKNAKIFFDTDSYYSNIKQWNFN